MTNVNDLCMLLTTTRQLNFVTSRAEDKKFQREAAMQILDLGFKTQEEISQIAESMGFGSSSVKIASIAKSFVEKWEKRK